MILSMLVAVEKLYRLSRAIGESPFADDDFVAPVRAVLGACSEAVELAGRHHTQWFFENLRDHEPIFVENLLLAFFRETFIKFLLPRSLVRFGAIPRSYP
jgi:hypothetical protein